MVLCSRAAIVLAVVLGIWAAGGSALAQGADIIDYHYPQPIPFYAGGLDPALFNQVYGTEVVDVALLFPAYFYRPIDDLTPRPGAQALAMGGAYLAQAQGALALGWNPGALGRMRSADAAIDGLVRSSSSTSQDLPDTVFVEGQPEFQIRDYQVNLGGGRNFGFAGGAMPLFSIGPRPLVGGAAYRRHTDVAYGEETVLEMGLFDATTFPFVLGMDNDERGSIESLTLGLGYQPIEIGSLWLSVGASANFLTGRQNSEVLSRVSVRGYEEGHLNYRMRYKGFSTELGVQAGYGKLIRFGGWLGLPHSIYVHDGKFSSLPVIPPTALEVIRTSGTIADYDLEIPAFFSAGVAVGPIRGVELSADVNYRPWSDAEIKHRLDEYKIFDTKYPAADVTSYHVGGRFEFPLLRRQLHGIGLRLMTMGGYRTLPLSMRGLDIFTGEAPYYFGEQVDGSAASFGFSVETAANLTFSLGVEYQSYQFRKWFLDDTSDTEDRDLSFRNPNERAPVIDRSVTLIRFGSELHF